MKGGKREREVKECENEPALWLMLDRARASCPGAPKSARRRRDRHSSTPRPGIASPASPKWTSGRANLGGVHIRRRISVERWAKKCPSARSDVTGRFGQCKIISLRVRW